jgi:hypothetical protein
MQISNLHLHGQALDLNSARRLDVVICRLVLPGVGAISRLCGSIVRRDSL